MKKHKWLPSIVKQKKPEYKIDNKTMMILERDLFQLPLDYIDCVTLLVAKNYGIDNQFVLFFDDYQTKKLMNFLKYDYIRLLITSENRLENKFFVWEIKLVRDVNPEHMLLIGGKNFRSFLDENLIFYKSALTEDQLLLSGSNLQYQQDPSDKCAEPIGSTIS